MRESGRERTFTSDPPHVHSSIVESINLFQKCFSSKKVDPMVRGLKGIRKEVSERERERERDKNGKGICHETERLMNRDTDLECSTTFSSIKDQKQRKERERETETERKKKERETERKTESDPWTVCVPLLGPDRGQGIQGIDSNVDNIFLFLLSLLTFHYLSITLFLLT